MTARVILVAVLLVAGCNGRGDGGSGEQAVCVGDEARCDGVASVRYPCGTDLTATVSCPAGAAGPEDCGVFACDDVPAATAADSCAGGVVLCADGSAPMCSPPLTADELDAACADAFGECPELLALPFPLSERMDVVCREPV